MGQFFAIREAARKVGQIFGQTTFNYSNPHYVAELEGKPRQTAKIKVSSDPPLIPRLTYYLCYYVLLIMY